MVFKNIFCYTG